MTDLRRTFLPSGDHDPSVELKLKERHEQATARPMSAAAVEKLLAGGGSGVSASVLFGERGLSLLK